MEDIIAPDSAPPKATPKSHAPSRSSKRKPYHKAAGSQSKSKMAIHLSGDNSVVMEFNSDSEDDDDDILRDLMSHHGHQNMSNRNRTREKKLVHTDERAPVSGKSMKQSGSDHGSIFSESDEDFCLVDAPTITKVVSELIYSLYMNQ